MRVAREAIVPPSERISRTPSKRCRAALLVLVIPACNKALAAFLASKDKDHDEALAPKKARSSCARRSP
ncbi:hypothetical protein [Polyangium jinanense]|uniref:Uncharacterized protein n=1 Tax=Polyangium jinanense TaxID=2829994 RepID=A0A9X4ANL2_9BACT|nr:hypothetical protein [Polyangium jinanense]MDC3953795.1 hypothetical protein [Polyangium jinanense]MDC3979084.1 hypothetical protein [Polyangium jinanense]